MTEKRIFTPEQMFDAERILDELEKIPKNKRYFIVALVTAYINGIESGTAFMQDSLKKA